MLLKNCRITRALYCPLHIMGVMSVGQMRATDITFKPWGVVTGSIPWLPCSMSRISVFMPTILGTLGP